MKEIKYFDYLDKGFIALIDSMGNDQAVVDAARKSYGNNKERDAERDKRLIHYLMKNGHTSPFEMVEFKFHIKLPVFVMRQLIRHRTASVNELSARYTEIKEEFYLPQVIGTQDDKNKQGSKEEVSEEVYHQARDTIYDAHKSSFKSYQELLNLGIARETAREVLTVGFYTEIYWKMDLHNLFHFLRLRNSAHAQREIRVLAEMIERLIKEIVPISYEAFKEYNK